MASLRRFTSREQFEITGRGTVYVVNLPDDLWNAPTSPKLVGHLVRIDSKLHKVIGVEMPAIYWRPGSAAFKTVGLLARPVAEAAKEKSDG